MIFVLNSLKFALCLACRQGHREIADLLIKKGADINLQNYNGCTALYAGSELFKHLFIPQN